MKDDGGRGLRVVTDKAWYSGDTVQAGGAIVSLLYHLLPR